MMRTERPSPDGQRLVRRLQGKTAGNKKQQITVVTLALLGLFIVVVALLLAIGPADPAVILRAAIDKILRDPFEVVLLVLMAVTTLFMHFGVKGEALWLTQAGIEYRLRVPGLSVLSRDWRLPWSQIRSAEISMALGGMQPMLVLNRGRNQRRLAVFNWIDPDQPDPFPQPGGLRRPKPAAILAMVEASPLVAALRRHGIAVRYPDRDSPGNLDLFANRHTLAAVALLFVLGLYGLVDITVIEETYAGDYPWASFAMGGIAIGLLAHLWLRAAKVVSLHATALSLLLAVAGALATAPALLRVNALTDTVGPVAHDYTLAGYTYLVPVEKGLPDLRFSGNETYWRQFQLGSVRSIELRRGGLGFYQVNLAPLHEEMYAFYSAQPGRPR